MHALHARLPKNFVLEERLERYSSAIELCPQSLAGRWREACQPLGDGARFGRLVLDLGCGKGGFAAESARREPGTLFVGIDAEPICIAYAAQKAVEGGLDNLVLVGGQGSAVRSYFAPGEVSRVILNFPTPFPKKKEASQRLTHLNQLLIYRDILDPEGSVLFKTDSQPLFDFSLTQFELAGFNVVWQSSDARAERPGDPMSWYEERLSKQGATVYALEARLGGAPARETDGSVAQTAELSLAEYLPQDLSQLSYVPHGMQGTVTNLRNWRLRHDA
ncbi:tRNA (guanine(46)-N(7))-methyltransferase TrmB [Olsenella urininfantis]|uniref:tRNA (guanine(46)-N(7))-methyltransferase TrmB n=1 Tax=Olsenella urininfantis TaxID=1871033 RepID=UPI000984300B|nr:methyltransferase domain-containing protein [Olsenella urininfantis]